MRFLATVEQGPLALKSFGQFERSLRSGKSALTAHSGTPIFDW